MKLTLLLPLLWALTPTKCSTPEDSVSSSISIDNISTSTSDQPPVASSAVKPQSRDPASLAYQEAITILQGIPKRPKNSILESEISSGTFYVPQYNITIGDYEPTPQTINRPACPEIVTSKVIPLLEKAASLNHVRAIDTLADFYIFGNHSVKPDYERALQLYEKSISIEGNGHSYFMLGFIYSSGLFGKVEVDQIKANLYYQLGMENGDLNSLLALAYRNFNGIGLPTNYELALHYYSRLASIGMEILPNISLDEENALKYDIRLSDFNGGIYGPKLSESPLSLESKWKYYSTIQTNFNENNFDIDDHEYVNLYLNALKYYDGDYFTPANRSKAFEYLEECVVLGEQQYGHSRFRISDEKDRTFLSLCFSRLGHMYLKGYGVDQNITQARKFHELSVSIESNGPSFDDLGHIKEYGLEENSKKNDSQAIQYYVKAAQHGFQKGNLNLAKVLTRLSPNGDASQGNYTMKIYECIRESAYSGVIESLYHYGEFAQSGLTSTIETERKYDTQSTIIYYKYFIEKLEKLYLPHLRYAFEEFVQGNFQNALIAYSIAAEQGLENAQISASYLLYQLQPLKPMYETKTFDSRRIKSSIKYLERSSSQSNIDSTILLGDLYLMGIDNTLEKDYTKAFQYYQKASKWRSSHASYKLGYMYEYGLGTSNNTIDYFLAKRYYDLSMKLKEEGSTEVSLSHKIPIHWALLRLRLKYLFNRKTFKAGNEGEGNGWLSAFKKIGKTSGETSGSTSGSTNTKEDSSPNNRATAHHEGTAYDAYEEYDIGDYIVIGLTLLFFVIFFVQNVIRQIRRMRNNGEDAEENENEPRARARGGFRFGFNGYQINMGEGNFDFQFFAI